MLRNSNFIKPSLLIWIIGWTIVAIHQIPITIQSLNNPSNWPPEGFVIVENRSGDKIMITEWVISRLIFLPSVSLIRK